MTNRMIDAVRGCRVWLLDMANPRQDHVYHRLPMGRTALASVRTDPSMNPRSRPMSEPVNRAGTARNHLHYPVD